MNFEPNNVYHIYNQGNNRDVVFYSEANYLFFIRKIREHMLPFGDILAWCLMPNHFHLMFFVRHTEIRFSLNKSRSLNESFGIMLRSYTNAINNQQCRSGSLFRKATKSVCLTEQGKLSPTFFNTSSATIINNYDIEKDYLNTCFNYIHNNPLEAKLVNDINEWKFSSVNDYNGKNLNPLSNINLIKEFGIETPLQGYR